MRSTGNAEHSSKLRGSQLYLYTYIGADADAAERPEFTSFASQPQVHDTGAGSGLQTAHTSQSNYAHGLRGAHLSDAQPPDSWEAMIPLRDLQLQAMALSCEVGELAQAAAQFSLDRQLGNTPSSTPSGRNITDDSIAVLGDTSSTAAFQAPQKSGCDINTSSGAGPTFQAPPPFPSYSLTPVQPGSEPTLAFWRNSDNHERSPLVAATSNTQRSSQPLISSSRSSEAVTCVFGRSSDGTAYDTSGSSSCAIPADGALKPALHENLFAPALPSASSAHVHAFVRPFPIPPSPFMTAAACSPSFGSSYLSVGSSSTLPSNNSGSSVASSSMGSCTSSSSIMFAPAQVASTGALAFLPLPCFATTTLPQQASAPAAPDPLQYPMWQAHGKSPASSKEITSHDVDLYLSVTSDTPAGGSPEGYCSPADAPTIEAAVIPAAPATGNGNCGAAQAGGKAAVREATDPPPLYGKTLHLYGESGAASGMACSTTSTSHISAAVSPALVPQHSSHSQLPQHPAASPSASAFADVQAPNPSSPSPVGITPVPRYLSPAQPAVAAAQHPVYFFDLGQAAPTSGGPGGGLGCTSGAPPVELDGETASAGSMQGGRQGSTGPAAEGLPDAAGQHAHASSWQPPPTLYLTPDPEDFLDVMGPMSDPTMFTRHHTSSDRGSEESDRISPPSCPPRRSEGSWDDRHQHRAAWHQLLARQSAPIPWHYGNATELSEGGVWAGGAGDSALAAGHEKPTGSGRVAAAQATLPAAHSGVWHGRADSGATATRTGTGRHAQDSSHNTRGSLAAQTPHSMLRVRQTLGSRNPVTLRLMPPPARSAHHALVRLLHQGRVHLLDRIVDHPGTTEENLSPPSSSFSTKVGQGSSSSRSST